MKKAVLVVIVVFLLLSIAAQGNEISPNQWTHNFTSVEGNLPSTTFTIANPSNESVTFAPTFTGQLSESYSSTPSQITIGASSVGTFQLSLIEEPIESGTYISYLNVNGTQIPLVLSASITASSGCVLSPLISSYITKIKSTSNAFTKNFMVTVGEGCKNSLKIQTPIVQNTLIGDYGEQPIALTGSLSLGEKSPGEQASFDLEFNVQGLESGVYSPSVKVIGTDGLGKKYETDIQFVITVSKTSSPISNVTFSDYPKCSLSSLHLQLGKEYDLVCSVKNPSIKVQIPYNPFVVGLKVEESGDNEDFVWNFKTVKTGEVELVALSTYKGIPVGEPQLFNLFVTESAISGSGESLVFEFFPSLEELQSGSELSILVKDNATHNIVTDAIVYVNGLAINTEEPVIVEQGESYTISTSHPSYPTHEKIVRVVAKPIQLVISPLNPKIGDEMSFNTIPTGAKIYVNGIELTQSPFIPTMEGNYTFKAIKEPFAQTEMLIIVKEPLSIISNSQNYSDGDTIKFNLSKEDSWSLQQSPSLGEPYNVVKSGTTAMVIYEAASPGKYRLTSGADTLSEFTVYPKNNLGGWKTWAVIIVVLALGAVYFLSKNKGGERDSPTEFGLGSGNFGI